MTNRTNPWECYLPFQNAEKKERTGLKLETRVVKRRQARMPQTTRPLTSIVCRLALYSIFSIAFLQPMVGLSQACDAQENPEILYQIAFILNDGSTLVLSDGSTWDVDHEGSLAAGQWQIGDQVCVTHLPDQDAIYITDLRYGDSVNVERQQY